MLQKDPKMRPQAAELVEKIEVIRNNIYKPV